MMTATPALKRPAEIKAIYLKLIDEHLDALVHGRVTEMQKLKILLINCIFIPPI